MAQNNALNLPIPITPAFGGSGVASPAAHSIPIAEGSSNFTFLNLTNGQVLAGSTGADPVPATITAGTGITVANGAGSITISAAGKLPFVTVSGTSQAMAVNTIYAANNAGLVTLTLPSVASPGDEVTVIAQGAGGFLIAQNSGQTVNLGNTPTTTGISGSIASTNQFDVIKYQCLVANTTWVCYAPQGRPTVT